jgi:alpha-L-fucosidase
MRNRWRLQETYEMIHALQPQALIISNHHEVPFPGEDVQPFEQDLPGENSAGFNTSYISKLPLEMAQTMNGSWGFNLIDDNFKSTKELIQNLVSAAGRDSNYLLNTGPMPNGRLQPENVQTYKELGAWLRVNGESIYGTRGGPVVPQPWGVTTQKANAVYVHVMNWQQDSLLVPIPQEIEKATFLASGEDVPSERVGEGYVLRLSPGAIGGPDTVIRLTLK